VRAITTGFIINNAYRIYSLLFFNYIRISAIYPDNRHVGEAKLQVGEAKLQVGGSKKYSRIWLLLEITLSRLYSFILGKQKLKSGERSLF
jgi:hypothetical protein